MSWKLRHGGDNVKNNKPIENNRSIVLIVVELWEKGKRSRVGPLVLRVFVRALDCSSFNSAAIFSLLSRRDEFNDLCLAAKTSHWPCKAKVRKNTKIRFCCAAAHSSGRDTRRGGGGSWIFNKIRSFYKSLLAS